MASNTEDTKIIDPHRLNAVRNTFLLDTQADAAFDRLTRLSMRVLGTPISLISLIDSHRQFVKSSSGLEVRELPLSHSLCKHVVATGEPLIVNDARTHPLVKDNPAVSEFDVIGYLGMPIRTGDGFDVGSLCVIDTEPREWTADEISILEDLSSSVMMEIELRVQVRLEKEAGHPLSNTDLYGTLPKTKRERFGLYERLHQLGTGGMSDVYLCEHAMLNTQVAVKLLRSNASNHDEFSQRFEQEAQIVGKLKHPNIVRVFEYGFEADKAYMVMEYIQGEDLASILKQQEQLSFDKHGSILMDIATALDYAHAQGIIHRDIKPSNVMLRQRFNDGEALHLYHATLMDFGIAKVHDSTQQLTADNMVGTVDYMSPEQIKGAKTVDYRADLYSFGVLAYQFLTGHLPFTGSNLAQILYAHINAPIPDPRDYNPTLTLPQVEALEAILAKNPADRPANARAFVQALASSA